MEEMPKYPLLTDKCNFGPCTEAFSHVSQPRSPGTETDTLPHPPRPFPPCRLSVDFSGSLNICIGSQWLDFLHLLLFSFSAVSCSGHGKGAFP